MTMMMIYCIVFLGIEVHRHRKRETERPLTGFFFHGGRRYIFLDTGGLSSI